MPAHRRPPVSVFIPSVVLLLAGLGLVFAALTHLVLIRAAASVGLAVMAVAVGGPAILAAWHLYGGNRRAWIAAMGLLPIVGVIEFFDA